MKKIVKKILAAVLSVTMLVGFIQMSAVSAFGVSIDIGSNPTPDVDIAVSVPADYAGDFDSFKAELSAALEALGMDPSAFRVTDTAVKIDTTNLDGWYVYDHYYNKAEYNKLGLSAEQMVKQPYRAADNSCMGSYGGSPKPCLIQDVFVERKYGAPGNKLHWFNQHTYSHSKNDKAYMIFAGYGTNALSDYMFYPATSDSKRTVEFDLDCAVVDPHTLLGFGFLLNAAIDKGAVTSGDTDINDDKLTSYMLYYTWPSTVGVYKFTNVAANTATFSGSAVQTKSVSLGSGMKFRIKVVLEKDKVTVSQRQYNTSTGALGNEVILFDNLSIPVQAGGGNGFGPIVQYKSHGCSSMTYFEYGDLSMTYEATAFDALKNVQYAQTANQKYFINLVGDSNDPNIPDEEKESQKYVDGINRMNENEIFYISNADDGKVLTDPTYDEEGNKTHTGLGTDNGYIATDPSDYIQQIAKYIYNNYINETKFNQAPVESELPLANFYITRSDDGSQLMTVHLKHLGDNDIVGANIFDKSKIGSTALGAGDKLVSWTLNVYDPLGNVIKTETVDDPDKFTDFQISKSCTQGRYTFELSVKDNNGKTSETFQTYLTVFLDEEEPEASAVNTTKNIAKVTLVDRGPGIDDDGITFLEDGRGSGVAAYWLTTDINSEPTDDDWEYLDTPVHEYSFDVNIPDYAGPGNNLVVWYKDECGNIGKELAYKPIKVEVQDPDGNPIDEYYIISDEPIVVLPDLDDYDIPGPENPDEEFSGWGTPDGNDVTVGDVVPVNPDDDDPVIVIRPGYSSTKVNLTYDVNATDAWINSEGQKTETYQVPQNSDLQAKINSQRNDAHRLGYEFIEWTLDREGKVPVTNQTLTDPDTTVYAQWKIASYNFYYDFNGGKAVAGGIKEHSAQTVQYNTNITNEVLSKVAVREQPTKAGYIFQGWSLTKGDTTVVPADTLMPGEDLTVYAIWALDTTKYLVHFDSNGGSSVNDHSYITTDKVYSAFSTPARAGYDFEGWYEKIVDADGNVTMGETELQSGDPILSQYLGQSDLQKRVHTLIAKWTPRNDTKYTVAYYVNSGNKDVNGYYIYTRANAVTKSYTGTTEDVVSVAAEDIFAELNAGDYGLTRDYWYNAEFTEAAGTLSGEISGAGNLELKLYYDRYFDVNVTVGAGEGTVTEALNQKEGTTPTVSWQAAEGYHTSRVMVDDKMRDDLIDADAYTLEQAIHENHKVYVEFEKDAEPDPDKPPVNPPVDPDNPDVPTPPVDPNDKDSYFTISTAIEGCYDGTCTITPSSRVLKGTNSTVEWNIANNYTVTAVLIDGVEVNKDIASADFTGVKADHSVVVKVAKLPSSGANVTKDQYTVTVNVYGGDDSVVVTPSTVADAGKTVLIQWNATASTTYEVFRVVIDGKEYTSNNINKVNYYFRNLKGNHVVDIYLAEKGSPEMPVYPDDEFIKLNTQIVGGPGTITNGGVISSGSDKDVKWDINKQTDPTASDYTYYEVEKVTVNGEEKTSDVTEGKLNLKDITEDTQVVVEIKPVYHTVNVLKYGNGSVSSSKTMYKYQSYVDISGTPDSGSGIAKVVVDGVTVYPAASASALALDDTNNDVVNYNTVDKTALAMGISSLTDDHTVEVYFTELDTDTNEPTPVPDDVTLYTVTATVNGVTGAAVEGQGKVAPGENSTVTWTIPAGYRVTKVTVNGLATVLEGNTITLSDINADQDIQVYVEKTTTPGDTDIPVKPDNHDNHYVVTTEIVGTGGTISGAGTYDEDVESTVVWSVTNDASDDEHNYVVKYVIVDGVVRTDLANADSVDFNDGKDHKVVVVIDEENKIPTNIDKDGDGDPDINIDKDGDGDPDINIDKDGDGDPDINIDEDDDGEPDKNIDEDGDLVIDTYVHVNFVDENGKKLPYDEAAQVVIRGNAGDKYSTLDKYSDNYYGYYLTKIPDNAEGTMTLPAKENYTREDVITVVNYVYALKDTSVLVNYVDSAGNTLADSVTIDGKVFDEYTTEAKTIYGWNLTATPANAAGEMTEDQIVVNYVYKLKDASVLVKFVDENGKEIADSVTVNGKVFEDYTAAVAGAFHNVYGYNYVSVSENASGKMTEDQIVVEYKYALKDSSVVVNYVDKAGNKLADSVTIDGKVFDAYTTDVKEIYGYKLTATPANATGNMVEEQTVVNYVYELKDTTVIVNFVDTKGNKIADSITLSGKVFDEFVTEHKDVYGYNWMDVQVEGMMAARAVTDISGIMEEGTIVVNYIYDVKDAKVVIKYVDEAGNELSDSDEINGKVFDNYATSAKDIYGYKVVASSENATGEMTEDNITVTYTYKQYLNIDTNGDGKPDINIDTDKDGEPDVNIDTDDDGKPDINIDKDGDGKPDINIDTDKDGEPDVNIDTDKDGEPDINIDTDGDGKPDINIDADGDDKPDVNIDTTGDGKPNINIDTTGDGKPNVNIDTDGDDEPDVNIDTTGDGKADLNIDTDGDGKADLNIDTDGDGKADLNIDTDGDGVADANIDTDGDGVADKNIIGAETPVNTGSNDMFRIAIFSMFALVAAFALVLIMRKNRKESEAEAE